jgi:AAA+ ATPase superfamily predicted ATPase
VIYGKKRDGKTALVKEFSKDRPHIYFLADKAPDRDQLSQLSEKVGLYFQDDFLLLGEFVMIFDEFPYLIESNPAIPALFQKGSADDFRENFRRRILIPEAYLYREPDFILREELREPRNYFSILRAISMRKTRPAEIINETGFDKNMVGKYLSVLTDLKIISREVPITEWGFEKSKKGMYLLEDHFSRFWFDP